ncbi:MAG: hypothetical protein ACOCSE_06210 [Chitinivibrionales bacterium]
MLKRGLLIISGVLMLFALFSCDNTSGPDEDENRPANDTLEVVYPNGGESFHTGDTVTVEYKVNTRIIPSCVVRVSMNNGNDKYNIVKDPLQTDPEETKEEYQRNTCEWIIGDEPEYGFMEEAGDVYSREGTEVKIFVANYDDSRVNVNDESDQFFTVTGDQ